MNNEFVGHGEYSWGDGRRYVGEWKDSRMHGSGELKYQDGRLFQGQF